MQRRKSTIIFSLIFGFLFLLSVLRTPVNDVNAATLETEQHTTDEDVILDDTAELAEEQGVSEEDSMQIYTTEMEEILTEEQDTTIEDDMQAYDTEPAKLPAPTISSLKNTASGVQISWNQVMDARGYIVYRKVSGGNWNIIAFIEEGNIVSTTDTTSVSGTTYDYSVAAANESGASDYDTTGKSILYLAQPTTSVKSTSTGVAVSWTKSSGAAGYYIYRKVSGGKWSRIATVSGADTLTYTDTKPSGGTKYKYTVKAYNGSTVSSYDTAGKTIKYLTRPTVSVANTSSGVQISWNKSTGASGYYVYRKTPSDSGWTKIATITHGRTLTYTDAKATNGTTYLYTVKAYSGSYNSAYISGKKIIRLPQPSLSSVQNVSNGVKLTWSKSTGASGYYIYRKVSGGKWNKIATVSGVNTLTYTDKTPNGGKKYIYTIKAYNGSSVSSYNTSGKSIIYLTKPTVSVSNAESGVKISWSKSAGASGYYVYRKTPSASSWTKVATINNGNTLTYTDTKTIANTTYLYTVKAYNGSNYSSYISGKKILYTPTGPAYYTINLGKGKTTTVYGYYDEEMANEIIRLTNEYRKSYGLPALKKADELTQSSRVRAVELTYDFSHSRPDGSDFPDAVWGENIAWGYEPASRVMEAWRNSTGHNGNMLGALYHTIGVSVFVSINDKNGHNIHYSVQNFGRPD